MWFLDKSNLQVIFRWIQPFFAKRWRRMRWSRHRIELRDIITSLTSWEFGVSIALVKLGDIVSLVSLGVILIWFLARQSWQRRSLLLFFHLRLFSLLTDKLAMRNRVDELACWRLMQHWRVDLLMLILSQISESEVLLESSLNWWKIFRWLWIIILPLILQSNLLENQRFLSF